MEQQTVPSTFKEGRFRYGTGVDSVLSEQRFSGGTACNPEYQLTDLLGTVRGVEQRTAGVNAAVVNTLQYDSFGKLISQSNTAKQPCHGFVGRDIKPVVGLTYNPNRYYSTQSVRFISQDPIGFAAGDENLYRYVGNGPTNATDPCGLFQEEVTSTEQGIYGHVNHWNPWDSVVFTWVSPIFQLGMEHEREKQFVQTQHEIALRNAGRKGTDTQINSKSHIGHTASVAGIRTLAETSISWLAAGGDFIVPTTSAPPVTPKLPRQKHLKCGCPGT